MPLARKELHALLEDPELQKMPLLVLGNKIDLEPHMSKEEIIKGLNLDYIQDQPWECMAISGLRGMGVERVIERHRSAIKRHQGDIKCPQVPCCVVKCLVCLKRHQSVIERVIKGHAHTCMRSRRWRVSAST